MKNLHLLIFALLAFVTASCQEKDQPAPPPVPTERAVLVYMAANNSLGSTGFDSADIAEMMEGAPNIPENGALVVYHHPVKGSPALVRISAHGLDTLRTYSRDVPATRTERMNEVFDDLHKLVPAPEYGLVLWSHGTGWLEDGINEGGISTLSFGEDAGRKMNVSTLARVLEGRDFAWLYFDCCYMSGVEVAYELREAVPLIVASSTELPAAGMPYQLNVPCFFKPGTDGLYEAAKNTFEHYDAKTGSARTCTISVINTQALERLASATADIFRHAGLEPPEDYRPQRFMNVSESTCRYFDFADYVRTLALASGMDTTEFDLALADVVGYAAATPMLWASVPLDRHCGLSTYILRDPLNNTYKNYDHLQWYQNVIVQ